MGLNLLKACAASGKVRKVVSVIASCAYAAGDGVCRPHELFGGPPHPTVACHAWAKRNIQLASDFCWRQHRLEAVCVCPPTLYGPGDTYHPERTKVVGALVRRFVDARRKGEGSVSVWGTGKASREVMYVLDAARLIALSTGWVCTNEPLNLAGGQEYTIADLAYEVMLAAGYRGELRFDPTRPDGQSRKKLQPSPASPRLEAYTALQEGLARAVADYEERFPCA